MTIYQRIGEAIASQGKVTLVAALTFAEEEILRNSGFKKVGTMDLNGTPIDLYEVKVTTVVQPYTGIRSLINDTKPYKTDDTYPRKYEAQWSENYRLTATAPDSIKCAGITTSLMDAAHNPLSILEDYFFPSNNGNTHRTFKLDVGDIPENESVKYVEKLKTEFHSRAKDYTDDSWTSYNQGYAGNRDFRNW